MRHSRAFLLYQWSEYSDFKLPILPELAYWIKKLHNGQAKPFTAFAIFISVNMIEHNIRCLNKKTNNISCSPVIFPPFPNFFVTGTLLTIWTQFVVFCFCVCTLKVSCCNSTWHWRKNKSDCLLSKKSTEKSTYSIAHSRLLSIYSLRLDKMFTKNRFRLPIMHWAIKSDATLS